MSPSWPLRLAILAAIGACTTAPNPETGETSLCKDPVPLTNDDGTPNGLIRCADGTINRMGVSEAPTEITGYDECPGYAGCTSDDECTTTPYGMCANTSYTDYYGTVVNRCSCVQACAQDADCGADQVCEFPDTDSGFGSCMAGTCATAADCDSGECGYSEWSDGGCGTVRKFACRDADVDTCRADSECSGDESCSFHDGAFRCEPPSGCTIGRPLTVEDGVRVAPVAPRSDWHGAVGELAVDALDSGLRERLADEWLRIARMEHASVASFARFTLELMQLGAPPELLAEAQVAATDEVRHAQIAWAIASMLAGEPLGPGPLDLSGVHPTADLEVFVQRLVDEACVGEAVGAELLKRSAALAESETLTAIFATTAAEESRHAVLGWKTLGWITAAHPELRATLPDVFRAAVDRVRADLEASGLEGAASWGGLSTEEGLEVLDDVVLTVLEPCLAAL